MKKFILLFFVVACSISFVACDDKNEVEKDGDQGVTIYQVDSTVYRDANGELLERDIFTYDKEGLLSCALVEYGDGSRELYEEYDYDENGVFHKEVQSEEIGGKFVVFCVYTSTVETGREVRLWSFTDSANDVMEIRYFDATGKMEKDEMYYRDDNGEMSLSWSGIHMYNEHGDVIKDSYTVGDESYAYVYDYTYQSFGNFTQITSKTKTLEGENIKRSHDTYEYDELGNNTCHKNYVPEDNNFVLNKTCIKEADTSISIDQVYNPSDYEPWQPNFISCVKEYDAALNLTSEGHDYLSVNHIEKSTKAARMQSRPSRPTIGIKPRKLVK